MMLVWDDWRFPVATPLSDGYGGREFPYSQAQNAVHSLGRFPRNSKNGQKQSGMAELNGDVTLLLESIRDGDEEAVARLAEFVYDELHRTAQRLMADETASHTLQPTALLNEVFLKLLGGRQLQRMPNRRYFFAAAVRSMRKLLIEYARRRKALKRGGDLRRQPLDALVARFEERRLDLDALNEGLDDLSAVHDRAGQVVTLRYFGGYSAPEVAKQLGVSLSTVESDFRFARAWLRGRLHQDM